MLALLFIGVFSFTSFLPQYLMTAMLVGAVYVSKIAALKDAILKWVGRCNGVR